MNPSPCLMLLITLIVTACNTPEEAPPPACDSGRTLITPIATRPADPRIYVPSTLPNSGYGPAAVPDDITPVAIYPEQFITAEITTPSLNREQLLRAVFPVALAMEDVRLIVHGLSWQEMNTVINQSWVSG